MSGYGSQFKLAVHWNRHRSNSVQLLIQLFSDWVGILSAITLTFIVGMAIFLFFYARRHIREDEHHHSG